VAPRPVAMGAGDPEMGAEDLEMGAGDPEMGAGDLEMGAGDPEMGAADPEMGAGDPVMGRRERELQLRPCGAASGRVATAPRGEGGDTANGTPLLLAIALLPTGLSNHSPEPGAPQNSPVP